MPEQGAEGHIYAAVSIEKCAWLGVGVDEPRSAPDFFMPERFKKLVRGKAADKKGEEKQKQSRTYTIKKKS
ncbi:hypothetical protein [Desulfovibrio psychrotolerans]|uniref:Uncharacterized protein n=1 Tax=Desulfovibrio psychrotolerans TaxID=415242 RepID=A0A7J0BXE2_9BACT|nr:hypothetical protein [Desulfovibrio psychrotolerans]GFM38367.1 hypothetical protein DSM19430T_30510 [Desulfovibrio psychrotolerans]